MNGGLEELAARVTALEKRLSELEARQDIVRVNPPKPKELSVREFILSKRASNDVEKTLAIGYYLERFAAMSSFNTDDLARHFQLAKEATPQNINDKVNLNIKKGHLTEAQEKKGNKKAWMLTNSGEAFVESGFTAKKE